MGQPWEQEIEDRPLGCATDLTTYQLDPKQGSSSNSTFHYFGGNCDMSNLKSCPIKSKRPGAGLSAPMPHEKTEACQSSALCHRGVVRPTI
jgi:hypothetical protein